MKKRTLGGDRLGSGKKQEVEIKGYQRSKHNLTTKVATSQGVGTLVPIHHSLVLAGDTRELDIMAMCFTNPTEGPLYGSFKLQIDVFRADLRLYIAKLHMNLLDQGMEMNEIKFPQYELTTGGIDFQKDPDNQQVGSSCILRYLGVAGNGHRIDMEVNEVIIRAWNALPWLAYWDIFKNYYANKQEENAIMLHTDPEPVAVINVNTVSAGGTLHLIPQEPTAGDELISPSETVRIQKSLGIEATWMDIIFTFLDDTTAVISDMYDSYNEQGNMIFTEGLKSQYIGKRIKWWSYTETYNRMPQLLKFPLKNLDEIKMDILADIRNPGAFLIDRSTIAPFGPVLDVYTGSTFRGAARMSQEGLAVKTYQSDLFNNWLNTTWIDQVNNRTKVQVIGGEFSMDNFLIKQKMYEWLNTVALAGNTVDDYMEITYDVKNTTRSEIPTFEGGLSQEIIFEPVISNSSSEGQPLGTIASRGTMGQSKKGGKVRIHNNTVDHAIYMVVASITPRIMYSQGNRWESSLLTLDDLHKPAFDAIGMQNLITEQMAAWDTMITSGAVVVQYSAGYQLSWTNYMTEIDRAFGSFAEQDNEGWMVLGRNYSANGATGRIKDLTTYIDPAKYNGVFAYEARDAQNFKMQYLIEDEATRTMSSNQIPRVTGI